MIRFPNYRQLDEKDCGPACLKILLKFYGRIVSLPLLIDRCETTREGTRLLNLSKAAETLGFRTLGARMDFDKLRDEVPLPCIAFWQQRHFVVIYKIKKDVVYISDPAHGLITYRREEFLKHWTSGAGSGAAEGIVLLVEPGIDFSQDGDEHKQRVPGDVTFLAHYIVRYRRLILQLFFGLIAGSIIQLLFPFLTQAVVDLGVQNQDINFIYLILLAQLMLFVGKTSLEVLRSWIVLHIGSRIKISLVSDFFVKLMRLPVAFFDSKMTGDLLQRINDHKRIENFLTVTSINVLFSVFNLILFGSVLLYYHHLIFFVFAGGSAAYFIWAMFFQRKRRDLDYKMFTQLSGEQTKVIELIQGMQEIKLHGAEREKRWGWEYIQANLFRVQTKSLALEQYQMVGASFINELKNIFVTVLAARLVIDGSLTLGMMLSVSYILGQLNGPLTQMVEFLHSVQNARISLDRLMTIHEKDDEENPHNTLRDVDMDQSIVLENVSFRYKGATERVFQNINLTIPANKVTAIVGSSGSGKTTLMKLLLKIYDPEEGAITIGATDLRHVSPDYWRSVCGTVMQEGFIFNDTIANNIAVGDTAIDRRKLQDAMEVANVKDFVDMLPLGINTKVGSEGIGLSTGQKQRILIARAVYKNPALIFLDEATSALDANNERTIIENLGGFFKNRTVVVIAHRLSTVQNADQIVVLEKDGIREIGNHDSLIRRRGYYYHLVRNQLQLDKMNESVVEFVNG